MEKQLQENDLVRIENLLATLNQRTFYVYYLKGNADIKFALFTDRHRFTEPTDKDYIPITKQLTPWMPFEAIEHTIHSILNFITFETLEGN